MESIQSKPQSLSPSKSLSNILKLAALPEMPGYFFEETDSKSSRTNGRWTKEEHQRFIEGLTKYGKNWKKVEEHIGTRSGAQIRSHAQKFFIRLTKEYKKRVDRNNKEENNINDGKGNKNENNRKRSNSIMSNFSNFELDCISENEDEDQSNHDIKIFAEPNSAKSKTGKKEKIEEINKSTLNPNSEIDKFISKFSEKHDELKLKLNGQNDKNDNLHVNNPQNQIAHYQQIINFFSSLQNCYDKSQFPEKLNLFETSEIKQNQSFFNFILKKLENFVRKNNSIDQTKEENSPIRIRKLSDLVVMSTIEDEKDGNHLKIEKINENEDKNFFKDNNNINDNKKEGQEKRIRKNSFKVYNELDIEENTKKLENLKRKTTLKDNIEKKQKI